MKKVKGYINCLSTYLSHIYQEKYNDDDYLLFLEDKILLSRKQNYLFENIKYENPWNYQPIIIGNRSIQSNGLFNQFSVFLEKEANIVVNEEEREIISFNRMNNDIFYIIPVDEFYLSDSKYFNRLHNKHYVLINRIMDNNITYFDSETMQEYDTKYADIMKAMISEYIHGKAYVVDVSKSKRIAVSSFNSMNNTIPSFSVSFNINSPQEIIIFELEALRLSITFQVIPYILMREKIYGFNDNGIVLALNQLSQYILICSKKNKIDGVEKLTTYIDKINMRIEALDCNNII